MIFTRQSFCTRLLALQQFCHVNKSYFAMFCSRIIASLKVDCRNRNDVENVFAIMIINREHKATVKLIKLWL